MKYTWEIEDFKRSDRKNTGYPVDNGKEVSLIGWQQQVSTSKNHYVLVSLIDGMVIDIGELEFAVQYLNKYEYYPLFDLIDIKKTIGKK